jgi:hypothetical protein
MAPSASNREAHASSHSKCVSVPRRSIPANDELEMASFKESPIDRQALASIIPLTAVTIALAEFLFDHTQPRWTSPFFWAGLVVTVALLVVVQILRFGKSKPAPPAKPDYSATSIIRRNDPFDRGTR